MERPNLYEVLSKTCEINHIISVEYTLEELDEEGSSTIYISHTNINSLLNSLKYIIPDKSNFIPIIIEISDVPEELIIKWREQIIPCIPGISDVEN